MTTNVMRLLESHGVSFESRVIEIDDEHIDAEEVARRAGVPAEAVFKTLVAVAPGPSYFVFCLSAVCELDLKKAARNTGQKFLEMLPLARLTEVTGYQRGGCSPLGMKRDYPGVLDESAQLFERIWVSAGQRGVQIGIAPVDLLAFAAGRISVGDISC